MATLSGMAINHNRKRLDFPLGDQYADKMMTESIIEAGGLSSFSMTYWGAFKRCNVNFDFYSKPGNIYELVFEKSKEYCSASAFIIEKNEDGKFTRTPSQSVKVSVNNCVPGLIY